MNYIRQARYEDIERIAEILVFNYRLNFYPIFQDDSFYFEEFKVSKQSATYANDLDSIWVYDDGVVKGFIQIEKNVSFLWALEKNTKAIAFYKRHGFEITNEKKYEEDTTEFLVRMER